MLFINAESGGIYRAVESSWKRSAKNLGGSEGAGEDPSEPGECRELGALSPFQEVLCFFN